MQARKWLDATFIGQTAVCTMHLGHFSIYEGASVCLSVAMVPTLHHLRLRAAQTVASSWVKFAHFVENELGHLHVEKRGR